MAVLSADPQYTSLGNKQFDSYYQSFLKTLPNEEIEYHPIEYETQTVEGIRDQVAGYMRNYYDKAIKQRQTQTSQYNAAADVDAASRGMLPSTYLSDLKGRQYMAEAADIANLESDYNANLAQTTADQYNQYLNRRLQVDTQNVANQMDVDKWNAQARLALEELAYNRGAQAWQLSRQGQGGGGIDARAYYSGRSGSGSSKSGSGSSTLTYTNGNKDDQAKVLTPTTGIANSARDAVGTWMGTPVQTRINDDKVDGKPVATPTKVKSNLDLTKVPKSTK